MREVPDLRKASDLGTGLNDGSRMYEGLRGDVWAEFKDRFRQQDIWIVASTPAEAAARIKTGHDLWADVVKRTGMQVDR